MKLHFIYLLFFINWVILYFFFMCETKWNLFSILGSQGDVCRGVKRIPGELCDKKTQNIIVLSCVELSEKKILPGKFIFFMCEIEWETKNDLWSPVYFFSWFLFSSVHVWSPVKKQHFFLSRTFFFVKLTEKKTPKKSRTKRKTKKFKMFFVEWKLVKKNYKNKTFVKSSEKKKTFSCVKQSEQIK